MYLLTPSEWAGFPSFSSFYRIALKTGEIFTCYVHVIQSLTPFHMLWDIVRKSISFLVQQSAEFEVLAH